ncbi:hypothetical protein BTA51_06220 [Hahella sp. CCB-MM4]|uniref:AbrB family transcriptional regulator n=1 Tax=Hahella sp. (strain CCB-MM4) TaxID=1926491 RepID=UPI000BD040E6|nr:AbrB family transcriptional regulator [Hahella sp. CCB-MM4]OZG74590.1 hypothetical protein BTA51_06220 [Hahella sp. CCB-MM4]
MKTTPRNLYLVARTLVLATIGGTLGHIAGLPSGWLLGSLILVTGAALSGLRISVPESSKYILSIVLGVSIGSNVDDQMMSQLSHWFSSYLLFALMLLLLLWAVYLFYRKKMHWPAADALFCSVPGNLAITLTMALDSSASSQRIVLVHSIRLGFLVAVVPFLLPLLGEPQVSLEQTSYPFSWELPIALALAVLGGWLAALAKMPAPWLLGAMTITIVLKIGLGWQLHIPSSLMIVILIGLGALIGSRFNGLKIRHCLPELKAGLGGLIITLAFSIGFAGLTSTLFPIPFLSALLAYAPGGIEAMVLLATNLQLDPVLVASHHLMRVIFMSFLVPVLLRYFVAENQEMTKSDYGS